MWVGALIDIFLPPVVLNLDRAILVILKRRGEFDAWEILQDVKAFQSSALRHDNFVHVSLFVLRGRGWVAWRWSRTKYGTRYRIYRLTDRGHRALVMVLA